MTQNIGYKEKYLSLAKEYEMFAHVTSHDLRDPLRHAVYECEELMEAASDPELKMKAKESIDSIKQVIEKVGILREYSYISNCEIEYEDIDCDNLLKEILIELQNKVTAAGARITIDNLPLIKGSPLQIKKLFYCLIDNAIKFHGDAKPVVKIYSYSENERNIFCVEDNGIGIDNVYRNLIFAMFQKINPEDGKEGFGSGLTFCKRIAENHNGEIWFESEEGIGTKFYFYLGN